VLTEDIDPARIGKVAAGGGSGPWKVDRVEELDIFLRTIGERNKSSQVKLLT